MTKIRVLQVFTIMDRGGAESMIMNYYRKIDKSKVQFDFLVHRKQRGAFDDEIEAIGGKIYRFNPINPIQASTYYNALREFFKAHLEYQIIHSHINTFSCFPLKIAREFKIPCRIAHAHIAIDKVTVASLLSNKESLKENLKKIVKLRLKKKVKVHATHLFSCGKKAGDWLFGDTPFTIMNNAIDTHTFKFNPTISETYKYNFHIKNEIVIGHVGRFVSQKNHVFLLKIFAALVKKYPSSILVLIGDGPLKKRIEDEAKQLAIYDKIKFLGVKADIPELCQMMDIFVFPSFYEGLPVTLIEAQAAGLKILASDTITKEVCLTDNIQFFSIKETADFWANKILQLNPVKKTDQTTHIVKGQYDIVSNTNKIQKFYLHQY